MPCPGPGSHLQGLRGCSPDSGFLSRGFGSCCPLVGKCRHSHPWDPGALDITEKRPSGTKISEDLKVLPQTPPTSMPNAKSLQSCATLCDPKDGSPSGSPVPGILQARTLEWVAISFSNAQGPLLNVILQKNHSSGQARSSRGEGNSQLALPCAWGLPPPPAWVFPYVKVTVFPVVIYGCESWTIKKGTKGLMLLNCGVGEDS